MTKDNERVPRNILSSQNDHIADLEDDLRFSIEQGNKGDASNIRSVLKIAKQIMEALDANDIDRAYRIGSSHGSEGEAAVSNQVYDFLVDARG